LLFLATHFSCSHPHSGPRSVTPPFIAALSCNGAEFGLHVVSTGGARRQTEEGGSSQILELLFCISIFTVFFSVSDFICTPESRRKLTGIWVVLEEVNTQFHPLTAVEAIKQRQNKWQCLGSSGIYSAKMKATFWGLIPNWSEASYVTAVGC